jgi:4-amino-4-deoxy-L-arabinose transferase-like glycosyltransferase
MSQHQIKSVVIIQEWGRTVFHPLQKLIIWFEQGARWEKVALILLALVTPMLLFYNLSLNPRPWHDEGSALSVARTLVEDGVYATRNLGEFQTFGPIQSIGPTVLLPVAASFYISGIGLWQGRIVVALYALITVGLFYLTGAKLFERRSAIFALVLLLASPAVGFLLNGRQVLGEVPALAFLLAGWLLWNKGVGEEKWWPYLAAGLMFGLAMITKSQYALMFAGTFTLLACLDWLYFHLHQLRYLGVMALVAYLLLFVWYGWQFVYYGADTFAENAAKLQELAGTTTGFKLRDTIAAVRFITGSGSGHFYYFWGIAAFLYASFLASTRQKKSFTCLFFLIFATIWLAYFTFWIIPWSRYLMAPAAIMALFVGKLLADLMAALWREKTTTWLEFRQKFAQTYQLSTATLLYAGTLVAVITFCLLTLYQLQDAVQLNVFDKQGLLPTPFVAIPELEDPRFLATFLNATVEEDAVIETWERELMILTNHQYHAPDQSFLTLTHDSVYHGQVPDFSLGADNFNEVKPSYVVVGWYSRLNNIYDQRYLHEHGELIRQIGGDLWGYEIYKLDELPE